MGVKHQSILSSQRIHFLRDAHKENQETLRVWQNEQLTSFQYDCYPPITSH